MKNKGITLNNALKVEGIKQTEYCHFKLYNTDTVSRLEDYASITDYGKAVKEYKRLILVSNKRR